MTLADLQTLTLSWLDDPDAGYFTLPQVNVWLNNAQREVQKQLIQSGESWYVTTKTTTLVVSTDAYTLPSDFLKTHKVELLLSGTGNTADTAILQPVAFIEFNNCPVGPGTPDIYLIKKDCIVLRPVPDTALTLRLTYSYRVADMAYQGTEPDCPPQYQEYIAILATIDGMLKDQRDPSGMLEKKKMYLELLKQDAQSRTVDYPRMVNSTSDWNGYLF